VVTQTAARLDGVVVAFAVPDSDATASWIHIGGDGTVTAYTGKVEVGQNIRTSLAQTVAEELRVPLDSVRVVMGDTDVTPYDIGTISSLTTRIVGTQLRRVAAAARELVLRLAAERWGEPRAQLTPGELAQLASGVQVHETVSRTDAVTPPARWRIAGSPAAQVGAGDCVTGERRYTSDLVLPGMLYGKVLRPPARDAALLALDTGNAAAIADVTVVHEGDFAGVTAPDEATAGRAIAALEASWSRPAPGPSRAELWDHLRAHPIDVAGRGGAVTEASGSLERGFAAAHTSLRATYTLDYVAHAPMEPRAAVARWRDGRLHVWTATQRPFAVRAEMAIALRIDEADVRVTVPDTGSAFGGKHTGDAAIEAARLARAAGRPVKVVWTRAEEFEWAYFRPAAVVDVTSGARADGTLCAWDFSCVGGGSDAIAPPYAIDDRRVAFQPADSPLRSGAYRALGATANHFARETHVDELAVALGIDPVELRRRNLSDPRLVAALDAAADRFGWSAGARRQGRGFGVAAGFEKGGYVATCAEVEVDPASRAVRVVRVTQAFDCGAVVNPLHLTGQVEGAIIQGIGGALWESVDFDRTRVLNRGFENYRVPRFSDVPAIEVVLIDRPDERSAGAGETPIVCIAPAVGNAIFDATGVRLRSLPLAPSGLRPGGGDATPGN
jgi:isoquinoline 1-oxidoreductase